MINQSQKPLEAWEYFTLTHDGAVSMFKGPILHLALEDFFPGITGKGWTETQYNSLRGFIVKFLIGT